MAAIKEPVLYYATAGYVIDVPNHRGEELRLHLASHGIHAECRRVAEECDRLELPRGVDLEVVQTILDQWER